MLCAFMECFSACALLELTEATTYIQKDFYFADIGIMTFDSPSDSVTCCLTLVAGRYISRQLRFQLQLSQTSL